MSDPYLLRDGEGNPLSSIFHDVPKKENNFLLVKLFDLVFPPFEIHDLDENVVKKWFREKREKKEAEGK